MQKLILSLFVATVTAGGLAQPAQAIKQFSDEFMKLYGVDKKDDKESDFEKKVLEAKCLCCHQGKKKKNRNPYGLELSKLLDKKKDKKDTEKIVEALKKVEKMHTDPSNEKSPTYGEMIKAGKLPGGPLEEVKQEPEGNDEK